MRVGRLIKVVLLALSAIASASAQQLSPQNEAELLQGKIASAVRAHNYGRVLTLIEQYRALSVPFVTAYYYTEAYAARQLGQQERALSAATAYLNAPDGQEFHAEALQLVAAIRNGIETKTRSEMQIHWAKGATSRPAILHGYALVDGRRVNLIGMTLQCNYWFAATTPTKTQLKEEELADDGLFTERWKRDTMTVTLHVLDEPRSGPNQPPWQGYYVFDEKWTDYTSVDADSVTLWGDSNPYQAPLSIYGKTSDDLERDNQPRSHNESYSLGERFWVDLSRLRVHQTIDPQFSHSGFCSNAVASWCTSALAKIKAVWSSKPTVCVLAPYRKPPDPEPHD